MALITLNSNLIHSLALDGPTLNSDLTHNYWLFPQIYSPESGGGNPHQLDEAIKVMASHVVELHDNGGEVMHVPPGEDISERLVPVTADTQGSDNGITESGDGKPNSSGQTGI